MIKVILYESVYFVLLTGLEPVSHEATVFKTVACTYFATGA